MYLVLRKSIALMAPFSPNQEQNGTQIKSFHFAEKFIDKFQYWNINLDEYIFTNEKTELI